MPKATPVSISIKNARIFAGNRTRLVTIFARFGLITKIVSQKKVVSAAGAIDAKGLLVLPGFIDCHTHLFSIGRSKRQIDLHGASSIKELQARISSFLEGRGSASRSANEQSQWVIGRGWEQDKLGRSPNRFDVDQVVKERPTILVRTCGHIAVLNSKALDLLDLNKCDPECVEVDRDRNPTGIVKETALGEAWDLVPPDSLEDLMSAFLEAQERCLQNGIVAAHCILDSDWRLQVKAIRNLEKSRQLLIKVGLFLPISALQAFEGREYEINKWMLSGERFRVLGFKLFADGSLGARTAALIEDYSDEPGNRGILNYSDEEIVDFARRVKKIKGRLILASHAIGDRAVRQILLCYNLAGIKGRDAFRIEHFSVSSTDLLRRIRGTVICAQPGFIITDDWLKQRLGRKRSRFAYPLKSILNTTTLIGSSDAPADDISPIRSLYAATHNGWQSLSLQESIDMYTSTAAAASSVLGKKMGSLQKGKECSLVILNARVARSIYKSKVVQTIVSGNEMLDKSALKVETDIKAP